MLSWNRSSFKYDRSLQKISELNFVHGFKKKYHCNDLIFNDAGDYWFYKERVTNFHYFDIRIL
jgi:hypothetical protein